MSKLIPASIKQQAIEMRREGYSLKEISTLLHFTKSTASVLLKNVEISEEGKRKLIEKQLNSKVKANFALTIKKMDYYEKLKERACNIVSNLNLKENDLILLTSLLFWAEGSKKVTSLRFTNSDHRMIKIFLKLLRSSFDIDENKFRVNIHLHQSHNVITEIEYWAKITGIPSSQFYKPYIKPHTGIRKKPNYRGCITINYFNSSIARLLTDVYNTFTDFMLM